MSFAAIAVGVGVAVAGGVTAAESAKSADAGARHALDAQRAGTLGAVNAVQQYGQKSSSRLDPYAGMGDSSVDALQQYALGNPAQVFQEPLIIPDKPKRGEFKTEREFRSATKDWRAQYNDIADKAKARGVDFPSLSDFQRQVSYGTASNGIDINGSEYDAGARNKFIDDWNQSQNKIKSAQDQLAASGITNAEQLQQYWAKNGQIGPGGLLQTYGPTQYNAEYGTDYNQADIVKPYSLDDYQAEWGVDPRTQLQPGDFQASPDYQFRKQQGMAGIESSAAARGGLLSGATLKALDEYNSNLASGEYGNWWNRDMQNRQMNLGNYYAANTKHVGDKAIQAAGFQDAWNRDNAAKARIFNSLSGLMSSGQNAATVQSGIDWNQGSSIAGLLSGQGQADAGNAMFRGLNQANMIQGIGQGIQSGITAAAGMYAGGAGGGALSGMMGGSSGGGMTGSSNGISLSGNYLNSLYKPQSG